MRRIRAALSVAAVAAAVSAVLWAAAPEGSWSFAILGDRTGEAQPGVYAQVWKEAAAERPAFVVTTGDSIEGLHDETAEKQWAIVERIWANRRFPLYVAAGNHDIWSDASERLFRSHTGHPPQYSFDAGEAHVVMLDNSRADTLSDAALDFVESDLKAHASAPVKLIVSHRPSWLIPVALGNKGFRLHTLAKKYGVQYVIAGHVHQMMRLELEGVTYLSLPSSGGHLRLSKAYEDGWFFGHLRVDVRGRDLEWKVEEARAPYGQGRVTELAAWGPLGLQRK